MSSPPVTITREDTQAGGTFRARTPGGPDAIMTFLRSGENVLVIDHTLVPPELGGRGVGKALVGHMVGDARAHGWKIEPRCSFVRAMIAGNPGWQDVLAGPL